MSDASSWAPKSPAANASHASDGNVETRSLGPSESVGAGAEPARLIASSAATPQKLIGPSLYWATWSSNCLSCSPVSSPELSIRSITACVST